MVINNDNAKKGNTQVRIVKKKKKKKDRNSYNCFKRNSN